MYNSLIWDYLYVILLLLVAAAVAFSTSLEVNLRICHPTPVMWLGTLQQMPVTDCLMWQFIAEIYNDEYMKEEYF